MDQQAVLRKLSARLHLSIDEIQGLFSDGNRHRGLEQILALLWALEEDVERVTMLRRAA